MYAPREINLLMLAFALPPTILILRRAIDPRLAPFLYALLVLYLLSRLLELLDAVPTLERVLFQLQMLATIGVLAWLLRRHRIVRRESVVSVSTQRELDGPRDPGGRRRLRRSAGRRPARASPSWAASSPTRRSARSTPP